jgi:hypothetical protein
MGKSEMQENGRKRKRKYIIPMGAGLVFGLVLGAALREIAIGLIIGIVIGGIGVIRSL